MLSVAPIRVMVVDDHVGTLELCTEILAASGCEVLPFSDPRAALAGAPAFRPDVLITDVAMPQCLGVQLAVQIVEAVPSCRVVFHTGEARLIQECNLSAALPHFVVVEKPARVADIVRAVCGSPEAKRAPASVRVRIRHGQVSKKRRRPY